MPVHTSAIALVASRFQGGSVLRAEAMSTVAIVLALFVAMVHVGIVVV
jgi:hypothetical protein